MIMSRNIYRKYNKQICKHIWGREKQVNFFDDWRWKKWYYVALIRLSAFKRCNLKVQQILFDVFVKYMEGGDRPLFQLYLSMLHSFGAEDKCDFHHEKVCKSRIIVKLYCPMKKEKKIKMSSRTKLIKLTISDTCRH